MLRKLKQKATNFFKRPLTVEDEDILLIQQLFAETHNPRLLKIQAILTIVRMKQ